MKMLIALGLMILPHTVLAEYDWRTGNSYNTYDNSDGSTTTYGRNIYNGNSWTNQTEADGNQRGRDADGNHWKYDADTTRYYNYGTGKTCSGTGYARTCW